MNPGTATTDRSELPRTPAGPLARVMRRLSNADLSRFALRFASLMTRTETFGKASIWVWAPSPVGLERNIETNLRRRIEEQHIEATVVAVDGSNGHLLEERSRGATVVLLPFRVQGMRIVDGFGRPADEVLETLPIAALVGAAGDIRLGDVEDEELELLAPAQHEAEVCAKSPVDAPARDAPATGRIRPGK